MTSFQLINGDCLEVLKTLPDNSVDSIVTDPPYGISFMGKKWDYDVPTEEVWKECLRVLKPGGHLLSFAGTRTQHRMAVRIEDAGFEIRDMIAWVYGSGFPKSLNIGKAVDKLQGNEREAVRDRTGAMNNADNSEAQSFTKGDVGFKTHFTETKGTSEWEGWGTALKPALEPITVARKPIEGTVAENCLKWGVGGINIDGCRVGLGENEDTKRVVGGHKTSYIGGTLEKNYGIENQANRDLGRFPANLIHDGSEEVVECFPYTKSNLHAQPKGSWGGGFTGDSDKKGEYKGYDTGGSAARFFYCAKASKKDRDEGLEGFEEKEYGKEHYSTARLNDLRMEGEQQRLPNKNNHPTVKPTALMRYLVKLVTPPGGTVLDPFTGSGSTGKACKLEGFDFIGIEREEEYVKIAEARIKAVPDTLL